MTLEVDSPIAYKGIDWAKYVAMWDEQLKVCNGKLRDIEEYAKEKGGN